MTQTTQADQQNMIAIVCHAPKDYRVEQVTKPKARTHDLVFRIAACGICASDCKCHSGAKMFWGGPSPWVKAPVIPGHEFFWLRRRTRRRRRGTFRREDG